MKNRLYLLLLFIIVCFISCKRSINSVPEPPTEPTNCGSYSTGEAGYTIAHSPESTGTYIGSPSMCILENGDYVASYNPNNSLPPYNTLIFKSTDKGITWQVISTLSNQWYSQLFLHKGVLYIIGTSKHAGGIIIRKSLDAGVSWTNPIDENTGIIDVETGQYHCAPTPVIVHGGRVWKAMEDVKGGGTVWGQAFRAFMLSAPENADLLKASNWVSSWKRGYNASYLNGDFGGWLEGNAVITPAGNVANVLRTHYQKGGNELASIIDVSPDGVSTSFNPSTGFVNFPGGCKKFTIRYDSVTRLYWSLSNFVPDSYKANNIERTRNTLALMYSSNLKDWHIKGIVLHHPDVNYHGFQYADFQFECGNIVFVSRTATDDATGGANSQHDANSFTFHRIINYATYTTPEKWQPLLTDVATAPPHVFIAGAVRNTAGIFTAGYWKNGNFTALGSGTATSYGRSVYVTNNDIYVAGYEANEAGRNVAKCWKNGTPVSYSDGSANASLQSVFVQGTDIYAAGYDNKPSTTTRVACYWKNGIPVFLGTRYSMAQSIFINANDIYVAGFENSSTTPVRSEAKIWKNGVSTILPGGAGNNVYAYSVYVSGADVYVAGYEVNSGGSNIPKYWKNGVEVNLHAGSSSTQVTANSIFVSGTNVYTTGNVLVNGKDYARYWINGISYDIGTNQGEMASYGKSVVVHKGNIYIAGEEGVRAKYWKNGIAKLLSSEPSSAFSIMVTD